MQGTRRNIELGLLLIALALSVSAYVLVGVNQESRLPPDTLVYSASMAALFLGAHAVMRWRAPMADPVLLPAAALLNGLGLAMIRRLDYARGSGFEAPSQVLWTFLAFVAFSAVIILLRNVKGLEQYRYTWLFLGIVLLLLPLVPGLGREINGAQLWIRVGPFQVQPAEAAKLALVLFFAAYLKETKELLATSTYKVGPLRLPEVKYFMPLLMGWGVSLLVLLFVKDLGSSLLFFGLFLVLLYVATARFAYVAIGLALFAFGAVTAYNIPAFGHVRIRVRTWLDPWPEFDGRGRQLGESLFALGNGGLLGTGWSLGQSWRIPFASTDFIFSAFGEELGLFGTTALLMVYLLIVFRGFRIALTARDEFTKLLTVGLVTSFGLQIFVIVGGVTRLIPLTGITLPFMSYGGSSLLSNYVLIALLCRISDENAPPPVKAEEQPDISVGEETVIR